MKLWGVLGRLSEEIGESQTMFGRSCGHNSAYADKNLDGRVRIDAAKTLMAKSAIDRSPLTSIGQNGLGFFEILANSALIFNFCPPIFD